MEFSKKDFESLAGKRFSDKEMEDIILFAKGEIGSIEGDNVKAEVSDTNRPDLWSVEGIARAIRPHFSKHKGIQEYAVKKSGLKVTIEPSVKKARPYTVCAVLKDVVVSEQLLVQLIQLQEKVSGTFGRKRKEAAIGIYDFGKVSGNIRYYGADPKKTKFVPLEFADELDLGEILEVHPKGQEFGHLLKGQKLYPIFEDSKGHILSMPPIINSNYSGKVTMSTKSLFVEVSGFDLETIGTALNVIVLAIADRGAKIESVEVVDGKKSFVTPNLSPKKTRLDCDFARKTCGMDFSNREIADLLESHGWNARAKKGKSIEVEYPAYRKDILHQADIVEDVMISYGYNNVEPLPVNIYTRGGELEETIECDRAREACIGLGLQEILTFTLTSKMKQIENMLLKDDGFVEIDNFQSTSYQVFRKGIVPEHLDFLAKNRSVSLPHRIFEVGKVLELDEKRETGAKESDALCICISDFELNVNSAKGILQQYARAMGFSFSLKEAKRPWLIDGRCAEIIVGGKPIGIMGEIHPLALERFGIENPVAVIELELKAGQK